MTIVRQRFAAVSVLRSVLIVGGLNNRVRVLFPSILTCETDRFPTDEVEWFLSVLRSQNSETTTR